MTDDVAVEAVGRIFAQFTSPGGEATGPQIEIPLDLNTRWVRSYVVLGLG